MFSDDFWSEPERRKPAQITLGSFFKKVAGSLRTLFAAQHAPDYPDQDALGDQVTLPQELSNSGRHKST
jgi:hypothetical protein